MISLITPPRDQIPRVAKMLADEYGTASNIKSRVNRLSVLSAITSVQARLKLYNKGIFKINNILFKYVFCFKYRTMDLLFIVER
jgi:peptide subunit release factor 1 (eRF1)